MTTRIELPGRPVDINAISSGSHWQRTNERKKWRTAAHELAKYTRVQPIKRPVIIHVHQECIGRLPDSGSCFNAAKASCDGLVDAGVLVDDSPEFVYGVFFHRPQKGSKDLLILEIQEVDAAE